MKKTKKESVIAKIKKTATKVVYRKRQVGPFLTIFLFKKKIKKNTNVLDKKITTVKESKLQKHQKKK
jgi:hypothetical protein